MVNALLLNLGEEDKSKEYRIFKSVLHTLRDCITLEESFALMNRLPFFVRMVYTENWQMEEMVDQSKHITVEYFINKVKENHDKTFLGYDFINNTDIEQKCRMVLGLLCDIASIEVEDDPSSVLPEVIQQLFAEKENNHICLIHVI